MNPRVLKRFIILLGTLTVVMVIGTQIWESFHDRPAGDYETELGSLRLEDGKYEQALIHFDEALQLQPDHRGALMGRALVFISQNRDRDAVRELEYLIEYMKKNLEDNDTTGRGVLAAAYANLGIVHDRNDRYQLALDNYIRALQVDPETVDGPGVVHEILYVSEDPSSVRDRARYIYEQLQLPEEQRLMRVPELDQKQRMYKP